MGEAAVREGASTARKMNPVSLEIAKQKQAAAMASVPEPEPKPETGPIYDLPPQTGGKGGLLVGFLVVVLLVAGAGAAFYFLGYLDRFLGK